MDKTERSPAYMTGNASDNLTFEDALKIVRGCLTYSDGYSGDVRMYGAYKSGIEDVLRVLQTADLEGLRNIQTRTLHAIGDEAQAVAADIAYNNLKNSGQLHEMEAERTAAEERKWSQQ